MEDKLKFTTTITYDDFKAFQKAAAQNSGIESGGKSFLKDMLIGCFFGLVGAILVNLFTLKLIGFNYPTAAITATITAITIISLSFFLTKRNIKKMQPIANGSIIGEHEYTLTDNEIVDHKGNHKSSSTYDSILIIKETDNNLFIFIDKVAAYIINKKRISSESSIDEITNYIKEKCNTQKF